MFIRARKAPDFPPVFTVVSALSGLISGGLVLCSQRALLPHRQLLQGASSQSASERARDTRRHQWPAICPIRKAHAHKAHVHSCERCGPGWLHCSHAHTADSPHSHSACNKCRDKSRSCGLPASAGWARWQQPPPQKKVELHVFPGISFSMLGMPHMACLGA